MNNSAINSGKASPTMSSSQQLSSSHTSPFSNDATTKHAMEAPIFTPQSQQYRAPNSVIQPSYQSTLPAMTIFDKDNQNTTQQSAFFAPSPSSILIRKLPLKTTEDTLRSMVVWSKDFSDAEVLPIEKSEDDGFRSAILHFKSSAGAQEAQRLLNGKPNFSNDAQMIVDLFPTSPTSARRYIDSASNGAFHGGPASNTSSASSAGAPPRQASRYNGTFQNMEKISPANVSAYTSNELPQPDSSAHYQSLFSPQSPIGNHLTDRTRVSGKALINKDSVEDDESGELLKDAVSYAQNGVPPSARRATLPQLPIARMAGLSLSTSNSTLTPATSGYTSASQMSPITQQSNAMSPTMMSNGGPPMSYQMSNANGFTRLSFPPVNPADQNPPCNTLYVGNLPIDTSEDELKAMFSKQRGYKRLCFRTKQNGPMCFVEFEDVSFATKALHELYGHPLHNSVKGGIRLSFSKNPLGVRSGQALGPSGPTPPSAGMQGMNGYSNGGSNYGATNGPPPGLTAPPGLGPSRIQYGSVMNPMASMNGHYNNGYGGNNNWNNQYNGMGPMVAMMNQAATTNGNSGGFPPAYMMGR